MMESNQAPNPFAAASEATRCACFNLRKAARAVTQLYDAALEPAGLRATQFSLLAAAAALGSPTVGELARAMVMDRTTLTRNLRPLERQALIALSPGADRRTRHVTLTPEGRQRLDDALPLWRRAQLGIVEGLGPARWDRLLGDLRAVTDAAAWKNLHLYMYIQVIIVEISK